MRPRHLIPIWIVAALAVAVAASPAHGDAALRFVGLVGGAGEVATADEAMLFVGDDIEFQDGPPSLPAGSQVAVLEGDPAAEGPFTLRLRFPADYEIPLHTHPAIEHVTVITGEFNIAMGEDADRTDGRTLVPGGFVAIPEGHVHVAWVDEETEVQLHGVGPWGIEYLDPADDPRN